MKNLKYLAISVLILINIGSCRKGYIVVDDCTEYDYSDCISTKYNTAYIYLNFSISDKVNRVPYTVYKGNVDDGEILYQDTAYENEVRLDGKFDVYYSARAKYNNEGVIIYTVDGGTPKRWSQKVCDSICWHYEDVYLDLKPTY